PARARAAPAHAVLRRHLAEPVRTGLPVPGEDLPAALVASAGAACGVARGCVRSFDRDELPAAGDGPAGPRDPRRARPHVHEVPRDGAAPRRTMASALR